MPLNAPPSGVYLSLKQLCLVLAHMTSLSHWAFSAALPWKDVLQVVRAGEGEKELDKIERPECALLHLNYRLVCNSSYHPLVFSPSPPL